ncbi:OmpH family outer membrane protein [Woodsholea maritima]|uniref:OmpH family outer membrane protein n=1 Tax=Woodsholea maritima TaxID=240237 RepID=UPI0003681687|nr:OmpH family outer membrane protein [Woodsholea maritima]
MLRNVIKWTTQGAGTLALAVVATMGLATASQAQTTVLVMNEERIIAESTVGQHIATRLQAMGQEVQTELSPLQTQIQSESEALNTETASLSQEAIQQRPDLIQRIQTLQANAQQFERTREIRSRELVASERSAMQPVLQTLQEVLREIVDERGGAILIDRSSVVYANESVDITATAIERLNARITTTPVNWVRMPQQAQQGAAQQ